MDAVAILSNQGRLHKGLAGDRQGFFLDSLSQSFLIKADFIKSNESGPGIE